MAIDGVPNLRRGTSVMGRIRDLRPNLKAYIDPKKMDEIPYDDGLELGKENIDPSIVGTAVDYLSRLELCGNVEEAFHISILGGKMSENPDELRGYLSRINGTDDESIANACRACLFDSYYRRGRPPETAPSKTSPDHRTCENIRIMLGRTETFFRNFGPVVKFEPDFKGAYTETVSSGDGDFLTNDTIWDFKVSKYPPTHEQTLQLAMYYIMGKRSLWPEYYEMRNIGIFNPRLNMVYLLNMNDVPEETIGEIERDVIRYRRVT